MSQQDSDTGPVTFLDVAAYFSDEQWKLLHEWQKELYKNVMKEIHQALISLGPLIATSVFSLRPKEKQDLYPVDHQDSERRHSNSHSPRFPFINSDICLREEGESSASLIDQLGAEEGECSPDPSSGGPYLSTDFCLRKKEESSVSLMVHRGAEGGESSTDHSSGHAEVPEVVLVRIKEEEEPYFMDHQHSERIESISSQTAVDGSMNKQRKVGYSIKSTKRKAPCQATPGNANAKVLQRSQKGTKSRIQVWSECDSQLEEEKSIQCESGFINPSQAHFHQDRPKVRRSVKVNEFESNLNNSEFLTCRPHPQQNQRPYTCTECDKSYSLKGEFIRHIGTHTGVRPYECTECEKSFFQRPHLIRHRRTHSGEKPYECPFCHKRFNRKDNLSGHQKIHTGEKPFQCTECEKRFLRKGDLNEHRRKHAYSETLTLRKSKSHDKIERPQ